MAYVAPNGNITLYKCPAPLNPNYNHTLWFNNITAQANYFNSLEHVTYSNQMYTRTGRNTVRVQGYAEHIKYYNYMSFSNDPHSTQSDYFPRKTFYAFITAQEYINENVTEITFEIDEMQTWFFDIRFNQCFIERQHSITDNIGDNIEPENLEPKEHVSVNTMTSIATDKLGYIMVIGSYSFNANEYDPSGHTPEGATNLLEQTRFSGYASTVKFLYFDESNGQTAEYKIIRLLNTTNFVQGALSGLFGADDMWDVLGLYVVPQNFFKVIDANLVAITTLSGITLKAIASDLDEKFVAPNNTLTDTAPSPGFSLTERHGVSENFYVAKNKKLYTFPYTYISVESPIARQDYKAELFPHSGNNYAINFKIRSTCNPEPCIVVYPLLYKNDRNNYQYSFTISGFPQLPIYNGSLGSSLGRLTGGAIKLLGGALLGGGAGALASATSVPPLEPFIPSKLDGKTERPKEQRSGALEALSNVGYMAASKLPSISTHGGISSNGGCTDLSPLMAPAYDVGGENVGNTFRLSIHQYGLLAQTAKRFDMYLSKYGYAQNTVGIPNVHARQKWTYVKTVDCSVSGFCPQSSIEAINTIMNHGITFWSDVANAGKYVDSNGNIIDNPIL